jgi:hypothetical protein
MKRSVVVTISLALAVVSTAAVAQEPTPERFAKQGAFILSADRLFGVSNFSATTSQNGSDSTVSGTQVNLLWGSSNVPDVGSNPYTTPRLSFDYAVVEGVTIGGSVGYSLVTGKNEANGQSNDRPSTGTLTAMARGGYVVPFGPHGLWLRGGFTYFNASTSTPAVNGATTKSSLSGFAVSLEPTFVLVPFEHVGFTAGLVVDFPLAGSSDSNGQSVTAKVTNYGALCGVLVTF